MVNGIVNVYKERGFTSFDVVAKMRGILGQRKIGHTGTLDPEASGVLPVCLGTATRVCDLLTDRDKEYVAKLLLGTVTDTQDFTGTVLAQYPVSVTQEEVRAAAESFVGEYMQLPPMYSALKVGGKKLCDLARQGITVERQRREVKLYEIEILAMQLPLVTLRVSCSKGTYIRTLCQDIGEKLGCGGCMKALTRTRVGEFVLSDALTLAELEQRIKDRDTSFLRSVDTLFLQYPLVFADFAAKKLVDNGNRIPKELIRCDCEVSGTVRLYDWESHFVGLYSYERASMDFKLVRRFAENTKDCLHAGKGMEHKT